MLGKMEAEVEVSLGRMPTEPKQDVFRQPPPIWRPEWSKLPKAKYRELQNIPPKWAATKIVLIWLGLAPHKLRIFGSGEAARQVLNGLLVDATAVGILGPDRGGRWDFLLNDAEYEQAAKGRLL